MMFFFPPLSGLQEAQHYSDVGYIDRDQFGKIFDELDKDRIKEVALLLQLFIHQFILLLTPVSFV